MRRSHEKLQSKRVLLTGVIVLALNGCSQMYVPEDDSDETTATPTTGMDNPPAGTVVVLPTVTGETIPNTPTTTTVTQPSTGGMTHVVQQGETLYRIGVQYGINYQQIAAWNNIPAPYSLQPGQVLNIYAGGSTSTVAAPVTTVTTPATPVVSYPTTPAVTATPSATYHTVRSGETLYSVAQLYGQDYRNVAAWNGIAPPYYLRVGQSLLVSPANTAVANTGTVTTTAPATTYYPPAPAYTTAPATNTSGAQVYVVQAGDTLYAVARKFGVSHLDIANWNQLDANAGLSIGQNLMIYGAGTSASGTAPSAATSGGNYYTVQQGDTLYSVARRYSCRVADLVEWNNLSKPYTLSIGQRLLVNCVGYSSQASSNTQLASTTSEKKNSIAKTTSSTGSKTQSSKATSATAKSSTTATSTAKTSTPKSSTTTTAKASDSASSTTTATTSTTKKPAPTPILTPADSTSTSTAKSDNTTTTPTGNSGQRVYHSVQAGETLADIAARYGQTVHEIALWNAIPPPYVLTTGQSLLVMPK